MKSSLVKLVRSSLIGTSAMTLFSYAAAALTQEQFEEPVVLGRLLQGRGQSPTVGQRIAGWGLHYAAGLGFTVGYHLLWRQTRLRPRPSTSALMGLANGVVGIGVWHLTFRLHPNPPALEWHKYYAQLLAAHVVFGTFVGMGYRHNAAVASSESSPVRPASPLPVPHRAQTDPTTSGGISR
ncbi:hypothetical protein SAMN05421823_101353 [Catalinimonas alkaloidigena]|uniref:DUF1440 domain-containing protein n=1 Tax=Catalinimonas alkaloidigena TaxID=1075417 RepID=A0A1G8XFW5_9BACT|nr:hypothetical protein [Catalinimonas alkaloidigena]SDJ89361.1 hypothetical protein SAMN05421823_101353 [Catalinimonas alkaloidigena]